MASSADSDPDDENVFSFETDHLALRGNADYTKLLKTIAILEAQKMQIHKDIEDLILTKNKYLSDPLLFVSDVATNKLITPKDMTIVSIPEIDQPVTEVTKEKEPDSVKVRGRVFDQTKPETFNQLWTCEEQRRLEQLLLEYPAEPIEMRRFTKIAKALGNRTPQQVASRVQKFFKKLHSVGMPVPGRIPKNKKVAKPKSLYKNLHRPSTFFPAHDVPVNIPDDDLSIFETFSNRSTVAPNTDDNFATEMEVENIEYKKRVLEMLQTIRDERMSTSFLQLTGCEQKCTNCLESPVQENKWFCNSCHSSINLCSDCLIDAVVHKAFDHVNHDIVHNKDC